MEKGTKHTAETRKKISLAHKGKTHTEETKRRISKSNSGKHVGKKNHMFGKIGEKHPNFGKHLSKETKRKIGLANKGKIVTKETRRKLSLALSGKVITEETKRKMSLAKTGKKNPMWKGNSVGCAAIHDWVRRRKPKPQFCEECKKAKPHDLANVSGEYKRDTKDFKWLCRKCHMTEDGRLEELKKLQKKKCQ